MHDKLTDGSCGWPVGKKDNILRTDDILAKRELKKMLRNEKLTNRRNFYNDLMKNPSTDKFYQLIGRNKGGNRQHSGCLRVNGYSSSEEIKGSNSIRQLP